MGIQKKQKSNQTTTKEIVLRLGQGKESQRVLELRSMGATTVCETRTKRDLKGNALGLCSLCGILEKEGEKFSYLEIIFWFQVYNSETGPHDPWLYNHYLS